MSQTAPTSPTRNPRAQDYGPSAEELAALTSLELRARRLIEGLSVGIHQSPLRGLSLEFAEHRPYTPGDDLRHLDWKAYGKTDRLYLKRHHQETNADVMLLVDASGSMSYRSDKAPWTKFDAATTLAAAITLLATSQHDRAGVQIFGGTQPVELPLSSARGQWRRTTEQLNQTKPEPIPSPEDKAPDTQANPTSDLTDAILRLDARLTRKSIVVILSDLFDDPDQIQKALARLRFAGHDTLLVQLIDPAERAFSFDRGANFAGLEGEGRLPIEPSAIARAYREAFEQHLTEITHRAAGFGFDHLILETHQPLLPVLRHCLAQRATIARRRG
ncbi:DUF58 domain-containing protein [Mucisphaera sp.]|uniref:DUF58 domain-containing protein n=1 Tax=Mucisphaera sp. TaxID=2913024 RepID=UPI003D13D7CF